MSKPSIVFFGTSDFALPVVEGLVHEGYPVVAKIPPASEIPKADIFVIASYGKILKPDILSRARLGVLNVHPALLPKYRGPSPVQAALLAGAHETGVTIMLTDEKVDHGPILAQEKIVIDPDDTSESLMKKLFQAGAELLIDMLPRWIEGTLVAQEQHHPKATYTKLIKKEDGKINWSESSEVIERKIRAYTPWPSAWTMFGTMRVKILKAHLENNSLVIDHVQPEGRTPMTYAEFARGYMKDEGKFV